ncbi:hypothetical protein [Kribbibacterium absianum]|uniref:hypothetical protein n=1 Tax=Kribbibacterium absianum TaxID=3044210 RepID=UPI0024BD2E13|nr:hypothetical protein [Olsenella sp. YH-ols2216]
MATDEFAAKHGCVIYTGGGFAENWQAIEPLTALCLDKAALRGAAECLHDRLAQRGIFVGTVLVSGVVDPENERYKPDAIAEQYWSLHEHRDRVAVAYR